MKLSDEQRTGVENNLGLVGKVIKDKVHGRELGGLGYDDLFQIGCIGLCKAAATDKGGCCFSTYAYRLIWHEICDALIRATRQSARLVQMEDMFPEAESRYDDPTAASDLKAAIAAAEAGACRTVRKGIRCLYLMDAGYSCREIGEELGVPANVVTAWISKARKHLKADPNIQALRDRRAA